MTKAELIRFLEPFDDDIEIFANIGVNHIGTVQVYPFVGTDYRVISGVEEIWLKPSLVSLTRR